MAGAAARVAVWVDVVADILSQPIREFPLGVIGRALVETFQADAASRTWRSPEGRAEFSAVARPGATFGGRPLSEAGRTIARAANSDLLKHHPLLKWYGLTHTIAPQTMDRVPRAIALTPRSIEATELMGRHGLSRQLAIPLARPGRAGGAVVVCRSGGEDFSDEDLEVAARIAPLFRALRAQTELLRGTPSVRPRGALSDRELSVLVLLARGYTSFAIASHLRCAPRTVEKHLEHVYRKLEVSDRVSAVREARVMGVLDAATRELSEHEAGASEAPPQWRVS